MKDLVSLDHFVRPRQHVLRNRQTNLLCRFQIDDQLKLCRLLDGEIGGLAAFQDFVQVCSYAPVAVSEVCAVVHEPAGIYTCSGLVHRR